MMTRNAPFPWKSYRLRIGCSHSGHVLSSMCPRSELQLHNDCRFLGIEIVSGNQFTDDETKFLVQPDDPCIALPHVGDYDFEPPLSGRINLPLLLLRAQPLPPKLRQYSGADYV